MAGLEGTVIAVDARGAHVDVAGETLFCRVRGRFYEERAGQKRPIAPGDRVTVERTTEGEGVVEEIHPRRTRLSRKAAHGDLEQVIAANVERVAIVVATRNPPLRPSLIDRLIVAASNRGVEPFVVVNKIDLGREKKVEEVRRTFTDLGYDVVLTSATEGWGVDVLTKMLADRTTVFAGHSGVGKSSLLNAVDPALHLKVGEVSRATSKGRHTTTRTELLRLSGGGYVVDTPGIRAFGIFDVEPEDLDIFFKEFQPLIERCRFYDCTHAHEPECAVRAAVEAGEIRRPRYEAYLRILGSLSE
jgi:ribosome biogenesis GTPase